MSKATVKASVAPNDRVIASQVSRTRRPQRAAAPRKSAKKSRSGSPSCAVSDSPGTGNANENVVNSSRLCVTICFVGPRQTEIASTHGMITATVATQADVSKNERNHHARSVTAPSLAKFARTSSPTSENTTASTATHDPRLQEPGHPPERQREVDEPEDGRDDEEPEEQDLRPQAGDGQRIPRDVVDAEGDRQP